MPFVLDASVALAWVLDEPQSDGSREVLLQMLTETAVVPSLWPLEVSNAILIAQRRGRLTTEMASQAVADILSLEIDVRSPSLLSSLVDTRELARRENLTVYDATYLDLATKEGLPLASLDRSLRAAALRLGVRLLPEI